MVLVNFQFTRDDHGGYISIKIAILTVKSSYRALYPLVFVEVLVVLEARRSRRNC